MKETTHLIVILGMVGLALSSCVMSPPSEFEIAIERIHIGMTSEEVRGILGAYRWNNHVSELCGLSDSDITYPLWDEEEKEINTGQQEYRAPNGEDSWEYAIITFENGKVVSVLKIG